MEDNKEEAKTPLSIYGKTMLFLKYGAGIIIAAISLYAARQEKAHETMSKLKSAYQEQSKQVLDLQGAIRKLEAFPKETVAMCRKEIESMRSNMTFFLMGLSKTKEQREVAESAEARKLMKALLKEPAAITGGRAPGIKFQKPQSFDDLPVFKK